MGHEVFKLIGLFTLYFVQALPYGFQSRYLPILMRKQGISLTNVGMYKLLLIPWICKFFISAFVVDVYKTKKFWLLFTMFMLATLSFLAMFFEDFYQLALVIFLLNVASATQDICVDWFAISSLKQEDLGLGNTIQVTAFKLGSLFSGGVLIYFMDWINSISTAFLTLSIIYFTCFFLLYYILEKMNSINATSDKKETDNKLSFKQQLEMLHQSPGTYWICVFVLVYKLGEQSSLNMMPMYLIDKQVSPKKIGLWTGITGQTFSILGSLTSGLLLKKTSYSTEYWLKITNQIRVIPISIMTLILISYENSAKINLNDSYSLVLILLFVQIQLFLSGLLTTFTFTTMMEISYLAPKSIQATHFSLLATCEVFGKLLLQPIVSAFTDKFGYQAAFILFTFLYLVCLVLFKFRPSLNKNKRKN